MHRRLLALALVFLAAPTWAQGTAQVSGTVDRARCESVEINGATGPIGDGGAFRVRVPLDEAAYVTASCGWRLPLFLSPGDDLRVTVSAQGDVAYAGRGAAPNRYLAQPGGLVGRPLMQTLYPLRTAPYAAFAATWDSLRQADRAALADLVGSSDVSPLFAEMEGARIDAVWAHGHLAYPVLHWRDGDAETIRRTPGAEAAAESLSLEDPRLLALPEAVAAARALVHEEARTMLREDSTYQTGDNQWLRAKADWTTEHVAEPAVRDAILHATLLTHLDQNGSEGIEPVLAQVADVVDDVDLLRDIVRAYAEERRYWAGDWAETYKAVEGTTLEAHIERPDGAAPDDVLPAFVWIHGGSFDTGAWYHCPFVCSAARGEGMAVVRLEQRSADRFQTTPADQLADARDALSWLRANAERLRIDPDRVVLAGFSSGATLSVMAAAVDEGGVRPEGVPSAAVAIAGCVAPLEGEGWFRTSIARAGDDPARYSPADRVGSGAAPLLLVHGTDDEYCEWGPIRPFAAAMRAAGNDIEVEALDGQTHFFLFRSPTHRAQALDAVRSFLRVRGLTADAGECEAG